MQGTQTHPCCRADDELALRFTSPPGRFKLVREHQLLEAAAQVLDVERGFRILVYFCVLGKGVSVVSTQYISVRWHRFRLPLRSACTRSILRQGVFFVFFFS